MNERENNLRVLASHLRTTQEAFDMGIYAVKDARELEPQQAHECGAVCCALGSGPRAGIPVIPDERWEEYSWRAFGIDSREWEWLFAGTWEVLDNTPTGAADRIDYYLEHGVPEGFDYPEAKWLEVYSK